MRRRFKGCGGAAKARQPPRRRCDRPAEKGLRRLRYRFDSPYVTEARRVRLVRPRNARPRSEAVCGEGLQNGDCHTCRYVPEDAACGDGSVDVTGRGLKVHKMS